MGKSIFMRFPKGRTKSFTLSYDDGVYQDLRLKDIFDKYGLKCTFNINTGWMHPEDKERTETKGPLKFSEMSDFTKNHEIAVHGAHHPRFNILKPINLIDELLEDRRAIEENFKTDARGMAYPFGGYSDEVVDIAKTLDIVYARTVDASRNFLLPKDWMRLQPTCHHADPELMNLAERFITEQPRYEEVWMFYLWGHSYEFDNADNWEFIEGLCEYVSNHDEVWYATNIEIYDYVSAYKQLRISSLGERVFNPTATVLYFNCDGRDYEIMPGEEIVL